MALTFNDVIKLRQTELAYTPPQNFFLAAERLPTTLFNVQQVAVPPINGSEVNVPNPVNPTRTYEPGDGIDYGTLDVTFLIDKEFTNYKEIVKWVKGINAPDDLQQYSDYINENQASRTSGFQRTMSDLYLYGTDSANRPLVEWKFRHAFPLSVDGPQYDATNPGIEYLTSNASFRYMFFELSTYTNGIKDNEVI